MVRTVMTEADTSDSSSIPLKKDKYETARTLAMTTRALVDINHVTNEKLWAPPLTEERAGEFEDFFNSIGKIDIWDRDLFFLIDEVCAPYFAGDRTLDDTLRLLDNRVTVYVNENR